MGGAYALIKIKYHGSNNHLGGGKCMWFLECIEVYIHTTSSSNFQIGDKAINFIEYLLPVCNVEETANISTIKQPTTIVFQGP